jgi:hypothetical protein
LWTFCLGWLWTMILPIFTSWIARIKSVSHHAWLITPSLTSQFCSLRKEHGPFCVGVLKGRSGGGGHHFCSCYNGPTSVIRHTLLQWMLGSIVQLCPESRKRVLEHQVVFAMSSSLVFENLLDFVSETENYA